jgi:hypothetical protein
MSGISCISVVPYVGDDEHFSDDQCVSAMASILVMTNDPPCPKCPVLASCMLIARGASRAMPCMEGGGPRARQGDAAAPRHVCDSRAFPAFSASLHSLQVRTSPRQQAPAARTRRMAAGAARALQGTKSTRRATRAQIRMRPHCLGMFRTELSHDLVRPQVVDATPPSLPGHGPSPGRLLRPGLLSAESAVGSGIKALLQIKDEVIHGFASFQLVCMVGQLVAVYCGTRVIPSARSGGDASTGGRLSNPSNCRTVKRLEPAASSEFHVSAHGDCAAIAGPVLRKAPKHVHRRTGEAAR